MNIATIALLYASGGNGNEPPYDLGNVGNNGGGQKPAIGKIGAGGTGHGSDMTANEAINTDLSIYEITTTVVIVLVLGFLLKRLFTKR